MNLEHYTKNNIAFVQLPKRILMADAKATKKGKKSGDVCLFGMRDTVRALFELTRLQSVFPIEERQQDAIERLSA